MRPGGEASMRGKLSARDVAFSFGDILRPAKIAPVILVGAEGEDRFALGSETEIGRNDGKDALLGQVSEDARRDDVNAAKGERVDLLGRQSPLNFRAGTGTRADTAAAELAMLVE